MLSTTAQIHLWAESWGSKKLLNQEDLIRNRSREMQIRSSTKNCASNKRLRKWKLLKLVRRKMQKSTSLEILSRMLMQTQTMMMNQENHLKSAKIRKELRRTNKKVLLISLTRLPRKAREKNSVRLISPRELVSTRKLSCA